ncbi:hypothetical protein EPO05_00875 [Patescibacteria group bacterium]|nr:MAG: hypothetical protein EPO05_00875 [Patescibacteria group bacterium]
MVGTDIMLPSRLHTIFGIILGLFLAPCLALANNQNLPSSSPSQQIVTVDNYEEPIDSQEYLLWVKIEPTLVIVDNYVSEIENVHLCPPQSIWYCSLTLSERQLEGIKKIEHLTLNHNLIKTYLDNLATRVDRPAVDSKFKIEDGKVTEFATSQLGLRLDTTKGLQVIEETLIDPAKNGAKIALPFDIIQPNVTSGNGSDLGINQLIGEGRSNFKGSPKNRIFNIQVGTSRFNGVLIKPGEEFSFVSVLGPVDGEHGYLPELVIKRDKTEPEFGGGICQVSTTAFRAAINSGLKITARRNHAYPVRYYNPQGMDATVYVPKPDLRFINNTPGHILIQTKIEGTELVFQFYGTSDGRSVQIDGPHIISRSPDGAMKATFTQKVVDLAGSTIIEDIFNSAYDSPNKYPHPGAEPKLTKKPSNWSDREWKKYKAANGL